MPPEAGTCPTTEIGIPPASGTCDVPPTLVRVPMRTMVPVAHSSPSPEITPAPPASIALACRKRVGASGIDVATSRNVSADTRATPSPASRPPSAEIELGQPCPTLATPPHGQAAPLPSPAHVVQTIGAPV